MVRGARVGGGGRWGTAAPGTQLLCGLGQRDPTSEWLINARYALSSTQLFVFEFPPDSPLQSRSIPAGQASARWTTLIVMNLKMWVDLALGMSPRRAPNAISTGVERRFQRAKDHLFWSNFHNPGLIFQTLYDIIGKVLS